MPTRSQAGTEESSFHTTEETQDATPGHAEEAEEELATRESHLTMEERKAKLEKLRQKMACLFLFYGF
jgi:hypothetical protein